MEMSAPDLIIYSRDTQNQAADEILSGACPVLAEFAKDYCVMRDQTRRLLNQGPSCTTK